MDSSSSSSSSSSSMPRWEYDVFLSFHGDDTRNTFVAFLYSMLTGRGFRTFIDNEELERGKSISPELVKNINESRIAVIVFSKNYATSSWCLDELVEILECRKNKQQIVLPLFYDVKPSDVRNQREKFGKAFTRKHEGIRTADELERWRTALKEAAKISGLDLDDRLGHWGEFIRQIVQDISRNLQALFKVAEYEVGIDFRANKLIRLLNETSNDKPFVGIWGIGGIGKTTVAKAVFNQIYNEFEGSCFVENVREKSTTQRGLAKLQNELLRVTLMDNNVNISNPDRGVNEIKKRLWNKKILVVIDDVNDDNQLLNLVGIGYNWFGLGSRIIVTTRNKWVLEKCDAKICEAELLNGNEALELFSWHAFKQNSPEKESLDRSNCVKEYAQGLPLALQVLGSLLCQRDMEFWDNQLDKLKRDPPSQIQDVLKISYDNLDENQKKIFLDVACFFNGYDKNFPIEFFKSCEIQPDNEIKVLSERSLITISEHNKFLMHDLIEEMGRKIIREESKDPGGPSRVWSYEDINNVFNDDTVPKNIEGIVLREVSVEGLIIRANAFSKMKKLRILMIVGGEIVDGENIGCPMLLPNQLRYIEWKYYPGEIFFQLPKRLVRLELLHSCIKQIPLDQKIHMYLKVINFSCCKNLVETLNFYELPCLEKLKLIGCGSVVAVEFHDMMKNLKFIDLYSCENLKKIPDLSQLPCLEKLYLGACNMFECLPNNIGEMKGLKELSLALTAIKNLPSSVKHLKGLKKLYLEYCEMLESLPSNIGEMNGLKQLHLSGSAIKNLPSSVEHLKGLQVLSLSDCKMLESLPSNIGGMERLRRLSLEISGIKKLPSSFAQLTNLEELDCDNCNLDEESILNLPHSLRNLDLSRNSFASLPASFTQLTNLDYLRLDGCSSLRTLESIPSSISQVYAQRCESLERYSIPTSECNLLRRGWYFTGNYKLVEKQENNKPNIYSESQLQDFGESCIILPGSEIPSWFTHIGVCETASEDPSLCLWVDVPNSVCLKVDPNPTSERRDIGEVFVRDPESICNKLKGISLCTVIGIDPQYPWVDFSLCINGFDRSPFYRGINGFDRSTSYRNNWESPDHVMLSHITNPMLLRNSDARYIKISFSGSVKRLWFSDYEVAKDINIPVKKWGIHLHMDTSLQRAALSE